MLNIEKFNKNKVQVLQVNCNLLMEDNFFKKLKIQFIIVPEANESMHSVNH